MQDLWHMLDWLFGINTAGSSLTTVQTIGRTTVIYLTGYLLLRLGEQRFIGKNTAFDVVLGFILGSTLSRAINGAGEFLDTAVAGLILLALHWLFATLAYRSDRLNVWLNGRAIPIIQDGLLQRDNMRATHINERVLLENLRLNGQIDDPSSVREAFYELSGHISVIPKDNGQPQVVEVQVQDGVQTVRIELQR